MENDRFWDVLDVHYCVRWSPSGAALAVASSNQTANLIDFGTGNIILTGKGTDKPPLELPEEPVLHEGPWSGIPPEYRQPRNTGNDLET